MGHGDRGVPSRGQPERERSRLRPESLASQSHSHARAPQVSNRRPSVWDCFDTRMAGANGVKCGLRSDKPNGEPNVFAGENAGTADDDFVRFQETADELGRCIDW